MADVIEIVEPATTNKKKRKRKPKTICRREKADVFIYKADPPEWWHRTPCVYAFNHPKVRSRLERLMGSNLVRLTDRNYMLKLHDRILEDYIQSKNNRIADREMQEREREKNLVLSGKLPFSNAPKDMENHPVLLIHEHCEKLIAERRALIKVPKVCIPLYLYVDTTPDPPSGLSISDGHIFRPTNESLCVPPRVHLEFSEEDDIARGYMFTADDYETKKVYEDPLIDEFSLVESVEEMYDLADELIGPLKTITPDKN